MHRVELEPFRHINERIRVSIIRQKDNEKSEVISEDGRVSLFDTDISCQHYLDDHEIVTYNDDGRSVTKTMLYKYFSMVEDKNDWKKPIKSTVNNPGKYVKNMISIAITFFTGSEARWYGNIVESDGYYKTADCCRKALS
jgi:hypothetical protein